jgi:hypothetical protein
MAEIDFIGEAKRIAEEAKNAGLTLRVLGAVAFRIQCPEYIPVHIAMERTLSDVDFAAYSKEDQKIEKFFQSGLHFKGEEHHAALTPELFTGRKIYEDQVTGLHVDIFYDELNMCHKVNFRNRLHLDPVTITPADLTLEKLQIVTLNEKDVKDMLMLLAVLPVGDVDEHCINGKYIADVMSKDWGFYYTTTTNLKKVRAGIERYARFFTADDLKRINKGITDLEQRIESAPKSLKWKTRAMIGTKVQWYNDVEEVERADHLKDIK